MDFDYHLPEDLWVNVLVRLPVRCMVRCKCVWKSWCSLITSDFFVDQHLQNGWRRSPTRMVSFSLMMMTLCVSSTTVMMTTTLGGVVWGMPYGTLQQERRELFLRLLPFHPQRRALVSPLVLVLMPQSRDYKFMKLNSNTDSTTGVCTIVKDVCTLRAGSWRRATATETAPAPPAWADDLNFQNIVLYAVFMVYPAAKMGCIRGYSKGWRCAMQWDLRRDCFLRREQGGNYVHPLAR